MITQKNITGSAWVALTTAGQNATCWLDEDNDGAGGQVDVRIFHSDSGSPGETLTTEGKRLFKSNDNNAMILSADNSSDIFYAKCRNSGDTAIISVDSV